jgi:hypothetical protein
LKASHSKCDSPTKSYFHFGWSVCYLATIFCFKFLNLHKWMDSGSFKRKKLAQLINLQIIKKENILINNFRLFSLESIKGNLCGRWLIEIWVHPSFNKSRCF